MVELVAARQAGRDRLAGELPGDLSYIYRYRLHPSDYVAAGHVDTRRPAGLLVGASQSSTLLMNSSIANQHGFRVLETRKPYKLLFIGRTV